MAPRARPSPEEIERKRLERAQKKEAAEARDPDEMLEAMSHALHYDFREHVVEIQEDWSGDGSGLAGMQWLGGLSLARFFDDRDRFPAGHFKDKRVLEVGAGCGLTGILLAHLGARVTITDLDVTKAEPNVEANLAPGVVRERVELTALDWKNPLAAGIVGTFDMIVAGECCYFVDCIEPLFRTMWLLSTSDTVIFLWGIVSSAALEEFNRIVNDYFVVERVSTDEQGASSGGNIEQAVTELSAGHEEAPASPPPLEASIGGVMSNDDPSTRGRALLRLHRRSDISVEFS
mmetsp:Transcript_15053/g.44590  ORF Transcript_15053/g.44590 Transcript_15053/m.44590 type:complete len:290 (-) Transcript_15053:28-897(-)